MKNKRKKLDERVKKSAVNNQWMRNVLKSMGYTSVDLVRDLLPSTGNFVIDNKDNMMNLAQGIRSNTSPRRLINNQFKNLPQVKAMDEFMKNMKDDLITGNFNNVDREMEFDDSGMDFGFGSFDDDMFGGTLEFVEEDEGDNGGGESPTFIDTMPLARAINSSTEATVGAIVTAANQQMALDNEKMIFDTRAYNAMLSGMNDINDNLATLVKFNAESTAKYHAASMQFYEEALELIKSRDKKQEDMEIKDSINDLFDSRGNIRIQDYLGHVKGNIGKMKDESLELSMVFDNILDPANIALMAKNPIGYLTKLSFGKIVPAMTRASLKSLDDALSAVFPALLAKINTFEDSENVIEDYLYKIFGAKEKYERYVDLDRYEKGAIQWDGEAKKALVEVIPTYLRRIESALTGQQERIYDYDKGVFTDIKQVKENFDKKVRETETSGYLGTKLKAREVLSEMGGNFELMKQFDEMMEEYFSAMTRKGHRINPFKYRDKEGMEIDELFEELGWDYEKTDLFRKVFSGLSMNDLVNMANSELNESRAASQKLYNDIRKDPNKYGYSTLKNGGYYNEDGKLTYTPSNSFLPKDRFGLSQLDYLRDIRRALIHGIIVYPEYNHGKIRPNADLLRKEFNEYVEYDRAREQARRAKEEEERFSSSSFMDPSNMDDVLNLSDDKVKEAYNKVNGKAKGKKGKISKIVDPVTDKVNAEVFKILFGGRYKEDMNEDDIEDAAGVTSDGRPTNPRPSGSGGRSGVGSIMDFFSDTIKGVGAFFTGQGYTKADGTTVQPSETGGVMGKLKGWFSGTVDKLTKGEDGGVLGKITADFMEGFGKFKVSLFGEAGVDEQKENIQELTKKIKERAPKAIGSGIKTAIFKTAIASHLGVLGSIILPGGPLGAALIGMTTSFLRQSETFNKWLFGEKAEDGTRMGGVIPQSLIDMVEKHGGAMKKGAIIGGALGFLPSFFLPGGPVTGAILGSAAGFISKSDAFQEFLYGENFNDKDNRSLMNGKLGQLFKKMFKRGQDSDVDPKLATFLGGTGMMAGIAQGVGLLPSFLLPGGPIMGAVLGLAGGIAASSEKFQKFLFGEKEVDGKRYGGLLTKVTNWFDTSVMTPIKIRMQEMNDKLYEFLQRKIIFPIQDAFAPIKQAGKFMLTDIKNSILDGIHSITNPITDTFKESFLKPLYEKVKKVLIDPLARKIKGVFGMMGKLIGKIITMPISLLTGVGKMADRYNKRHVIRDEKRRRREEFRNTIHGEGYDSVGGFFKGMRQAMYMTGNEKDAIISEKLPYTNPEEKIKREEELQAKMAERAAKREEMQKQFEEDMKFGKNSGWKWASEKQKKKHEEGLKKKEQWMREKQTQDLSEVNETTKAHKSVSERILDVLNHIGNVVDDKLKDAANKMNEGVENAKKKAGNLKEKAEATAQNVKAVVEDLRAKGQSHADGLDEVPEDGYLAELHEGEMVVPKKPAGFLRNMFGKGMKGITNMFSKAIDIADDEEEEEERKDREDNDEGLTDLEMIQEEGKRRKERYKHVSRKNADSVLKERAEEAKAKEEKAWRNSILDAIHSLGGKLGAGASKGLDLLGGIGKMLGNIPNSIMGILKALGITGALAALTQVVGGVAINEYSDIANENNDSLIDAMEGEHRVERLDADGTYVYDNQAISMGQKLIRPKTWKTLLKPEMVLYDKVGKPLVEGAKTAIDKGKVIGGKVVDYFNPNITKTGTTVLGDTYTYTMRNPDATMGGKIMGKVADVAGTVKSKAKSLFDEFITMCKKALNVVMNKMVEKFPKLKTSTIVNSLDEIVPNLAKNADNVIAKFGKKIAVFIGDVALDVVPVVGQVTEACCTIYDVLSGLTAGNTGNMFGVPESHVDTEMRVICSVLQGLCKFSAMAVIWLLNEITTSFMGLDFIQWLARLIYTHLPVNLGTKVDVSDQLSGVNIDNMSMEDVLSKAGITEAGKTILFNPDGTMKDWSTLNATPEQLKDTGISSAEFQNIARHQYNLKNGTQLDEAAWNDKMNKTLGMKIMDSGFGKRLRGITQAENLGLDSTANVTLLDRFMNDKATKGTTFMNVIGKMTGNEKLQNMTVKDNWLMKKYANWRNTRYQNKITKGEAEIAERQAKEEAGKGGWWNRLQLGWENWKLGKNKGKLGIPEEGVLTTEEIRQKQLNGEKVEVRTGANGKYGMGTILGNMNLNGLNSTQEQQAYDQYRLLSEQGVKTPGVSFDSYGNISFDGAGMGDGEEFDPKEQKIVEVFNEDGTLSHCITVPVKTTTEVEGFSSKEILKPVVDYNNSKMQSIPQYDEKGNIVSYTTMDKRKTKTGGLFSKIASAVGGIFGLGTGSSSSSTDNSVDNSSNVTNNTGDTYNTTNEIDTTPFQPLTEAINSLVGTNMEENVDADGKAKTGGVLKAIIDPMGFLFKNLLNVGINVKEEITGEETDPETVNKAVNTFKILRNPLGYLYKMTKGYLEGDEETVEAVDTAKEKWNEAKESAKNKLNQGKEWVEGKWGDFNQWKDDKLNKVNEWGKKQYNKSDDVADIMLGDNKAKANILSTGISTSGDILTSIWNKLAPQEAKLAEGEMADFIATMINKMIVKPFQTLTDPVKEKFNEAKEAVGGWVEEKKTEISGWFTENIKKPYEESKKRAKETQQAIFDDVKARKDKLVNWYNQNIGDPLTESKKRAKETQQAIFDDVKDRKDAIVGWYNDHIKKPWDKSTKEAKEILENVGKWVKGIKDGIVNTFNKYIKEPIGEALSPVTSAVSGAWSSLKSAFEPIAGIFNAIKEKRWGDIAKIIKGTGQEGRENANADEDNLRSGAKSSDQIRPKKYRATDSDFITPTTNTTNNTTNTNTNNKFVFYNQSDSRWGQNKIGKNKMKDSGCGPTSLAMAISQMTGEQITPDTIAKLGKEHIPGYSKYSLFPSVAEKLNMNYNEGYNENFIVSNLEKGIPVLLSGKTNAKGTPYTSEGHVVTATRIKGNSIFINDPRGKEYSGYYPINAVLEGLNKGMTVSPSNKTDVSKLSSGHLLNGWNGREYEEVSKEGLGIFGDVGEYQQLNDKSGETGASQITMADRVLSYARAFLNNTSKFSYSQPRRLQIDTNKSSSKGCGADCSSFVSHVLSRAGDVDIYGTTSQTFWDSVGTKVDEPQIGDVVCQQGHVGLYSGDGNYIHMSGRKAGIKESKAIQKGNNKHRGYKRVLKNPSQLVDPTVPNPNSFLGTVVGTPSGQPISGGTTPTDTTTGTTTAPAADTLGVFSQMANIGTNLVSSIFNGKDMFDPIVNTTTPTDGTSPDISNISDTAKAVWTFFTGKGYSSHATAGIMGNLQQESSLDPTKKQYGGGPGRGIAQWTVGEGRFKGLEAHAKSKGKDWTDLQSQLEWIDMELNGKDSTTASRLKKNFGGIEGFKAATDTKWAVEAFEKSFERAGKPNYTNRYKYAENFYNDLSNAGMGFKMATQADPTGNAESQPEMMNGWAYYRQGDPQWQESIGGKYMKPSGCGMTSHAMMLTGMFGKKVTPVTVGKWAKASGYWENGMSWDMPPALAKKLGLTMVDKETNFNGLSDSSLAKVKQHIKAGYPVILSGKSNNSKDYETPFTSGGHIVFAVGVDGNDQVIINDPRGPHRTKAYSDSGILNKGIGLRGYWAFDKPDSAQLPSDWISGDFTASPGAGTDSNTATTAVSAAGDPLGVFSQMTNIGTNLVSSIFNGKDMFDVVNVTDNTTTGQLPVGDTTVDEQLMLSGQEGFFKALGPSAAAAYNQYHIFPSTTLAQAALESAWGKSRVATTDKNLFGIKWTGKYAPGITVTQGLNCPGNEQGGARPYNRYQSFADSMTDHGWFLAKYDRYKPMLAASTSKEQIELLGKSGYAEDSTYGSSLQKMVDKYNLTQYDTAAANTSTTPSGDAGQGDGKTHWAKGFGDNKPSKAKYSGTSGMKETKVADASLKKARAELEQTIRKAKSSMENTTIDSRSNEKISSAVIDMLASIVCELQGINHNTAVTANGISSIEIVSANTPVSSTTNPIKARANNVNRSNSNTGYSLARQIASYK